MKNDLFLRHNIPSLYNLPVELSHTYYAKVIKPNGLWYQVLMQDRLPQKSNSQIQKQWNIIHKHVAFSLAVNQESII